MTATAQKTAWQECQPKIGTTSTAFLGACSIRDVSNNRASIAGTQAIAGTPATEDIPATNKTL